MNSERRTSISMLFVDDEPSIRLTLPPILEEQGFQVRVADSIASALQEVWSQKVDVLLSDLNINEPRDGFLIVKAARAANPSCVAILLTGYPDFESAVEAIDSDVDAYFSKTSRCRDVVADHPKETLCENLPSVVARCTTPGWNPLLRDNSVCILLPNSACTSQTARISSTLRI